MHQAGIRAVIYREKNQQALTRPLTCRELARLKRCALRIHRLAVRKWGLSTELTQFFIPKSANTTPILPLHLWGLDWWLNDANLAYFPRFLSLRLTDIGILTNTQLLPEEDVKPWDELPHEVVSDALSDKSAPFLHPVPSSLCGPWPGSPIHQ